MDAKDENERQLEDQIRRSSEPKPGIHVDVAAAQARQAALAELRRLEDLGGGTRENSVRGLTVPAAVAKQRPARQRWQAVSGTLE
jgi:hypothetical protein